MNSFPLLNTQSGIWLADQVSDKGNLFTIAHNVEMCGEIDANILSEAIRKGMSEADSITAKYFFNHDVGMQEFGAVNLEDIYIEILDLRSHTNPEGEMRHLTQSDIDAELRSGGNKPLARHIIMRMSDVDDEPRWIWYQRYHHIMLDGYSFTALTRRTAEIYSALVKDEAPTASPYEGTPAVLEEYEAYCASKAFDRDRTFWSEYCSDLPPVARVPSDPKTGDEQPILTEIRTLGAGSVQSLENIEQNIASVDLLIATVAVYLARMTGQPEQVIGVPFMRRMGSAAIASSAPMVNILPLRVPVDPDQSIVEMALNVAKNMRKIRRHQRYDTVLIQRDIGMVGSGRRLFGPVVNYRMFDYDLMFGDVRGETEHLATGPVEDIEFGLLTNNGRVSIELRADGALYSREELVQHATRLQGLLEGFIQDPTGSLDRLDLMSAIDKENLATWSTVKPLANTSNWTTIVDAFSEQVAKTPHATSLVYEDKSLSYQEMSDAVFRLARHLINAGLGRGDCIAVALPRSEECVIATFAIMATGATYLPLDINYPQSRISDIFEDADPKLVLTNREGDQSLPSSVSKLYLDNPQLLETLTTLKPDVISSDERLAPLSAADTAYVIFTSGSTGRPKGVVIRHSSLLSLFKGELDQVYLPALAQVKENYPERVLRAAHTHTFAFDSCWLMLFWLLLGQEVHILDEDMRRDAHALALEADKQKFDSLDLTPSLCGQMVESGLFENGRHHPTMITIGGEAIPGNLWELLRSYPDLQVWNAYGPTEFTVDAVLAYLHENESPVIGNPIHGAQAHVFDTRLEEVVPGGVGELYLSGPGIAAGYINRPDLTAQRFVAHPYKDGEVMYRTGDLVRYNTDGKLEYLGRSDHQVKIRGYRIEIPEIEMAIEARPSVQQSLVIVEDLGHIKRLVAYCTPKAGKTLDAESIRHRLSEELPDYMVPAALVVLDEFPLTPIGKIDRHRLPSPQISVDIKPQTTEEHLIADQVAKLLKLNAVGVEADFFALGGDSITAMVLCNAVRKEGYFLSPRDIFEGKSIKSISQRLALLSDLQPDEEATETVTSEMLAELSSVYGVIEDVVPLLPSQKGVLFQSQSGLGGGQYNSHTRLYLRGELDTSKLQNALNGLLQKHPHLTGIFNSSIGDEPNLILPKLTGDEHWPLYEHDLSNLPKKQQEEEILRIEAEAVSKELITNEFCQLMHAELVKLGPDYNVLILVVHHIIVDGWSAPIILDNLFDLYANGLGDHLVSSPSYSTVIKSLLARDQTEARDAWKVALDQVEATRLFDHIKPTDHLNEVEYLLDHDISQALQAESKKRGVTLNSLMQTAWAVVLGSMLGRNDVVFGTPTAGRSAPIPGIEDQIGMFLNTVPVRANLQADKPLWEQAKQLQEQQIKLMTYDELGLAEIQQIAGAGSLFDTLLVVENYPDFDTFLRKGSNLRVENFHNRGYSHYPLALVVLPGDEIKLLIQDRGAVDDVEALAKRVAVVLEALVRNPDQNLASIDVVTADELQEIALVNDTNRALPDLNVRDLLLAQVGRTPDAEALIDESVCLSFREVRHQALEIASDLRKLGVKRGDVVAVALNRSARLSIALLGICEAGATFLPLDLSYPQARLQYMVGDSKPTIIIVEDETENMFEGDHQVLRFDELYSPDNEVRDLEDPGIHPSDPCYILYTSGTTGQPKGVVVSHGALLNYLLWVQDVYPLTDEDTVLQKTPCGFDVSLTEFFWPFICGARLVVGSPNVHQETSELIRLIEKHQVTFTDFVPSMLEVFVAELKEGNNAERCKSLRQLICVGEALSRKVVEEFSQLSNAEVLNLYGPTEATIEVTQASATKALAEESNIVPIGYPAWNTELRILDHCLRPVSPGVAGELYLCGDQLAIGYLNRPDLTASRFVADPMSDGQRMYRTGDLAKWRADGQVEYLGRVDTQIKIAGQRVELGEIEAQIRTFPDVDQAVVVALETRSDMQLVAYVTGAFERISNLLAYLSDLLPQHMIPTTIIPLDEMPLTSAGKLDRAALPKPAFDDRMLGRAPSGPQEEPIADLFKELLGLEIVGADEDFFAIGGHSLMAMKLAARIRRDFNVQISVGQIIAMPTIEQLAEHIFLGDRVNTMARDGFDLVLEFKKREGNPLFCFYPGSGISWKFNVLSRHLPDDVGLVAFQSPRPNGPIASSKSLEELCDKQLEILLSVQPQGPYYLLGYSIGGGIAYGLAVRLKAMGKEVRFVGMLDTYPRALGAKGGLNQFENMIKEEMQGGAEDDLQEERAEILEHLLQNIRDANGLVSNGEAPKYDGHVTLFSAGLSRPTHVNPKQIWEEYANSAAVFDFPECTHFDIMSPASMEKIGPIIGGIMDDVYLRESKTQQPNLSEDGRQETQIAS
ncbi:amino acid adenylation domain-containing protein [Curvivirga sp.]|uniref:amino acid adenylation domain-containing protein n=1 Tax=Curvivirga sp. TaxID=2856848 RepID=UPI003B5A3C1A